jgi:hypothetical protein
MNPDAVDGQHDPAHGSIKTVTKLIYSTGIRGLE